mmetsp:Transcript_29851/g.36348  ORF Transcript_29851/g.36348 Transcript_29851/m.36348 type:complete len:391 (-) Transcript_29851:144-1316(-)|eukprot:CAMPEP_0172515702 /NCGR_PEP_ID=MMETSP1066-20121228/269967_1 /TAXON_ID=671091 /ORGANISM="Coscinodiscus wailesii, Strain CCMP2513" /LENGTH=390 /DNA_ID=CAMNT_0013296851 /DNA_START=86 /DNA_END=1258 /DNA_ORIENTATION=+
MANNGGRQGGGGGAGGNGQMNEHVEFTVKAEEDLYLEGTENTIRRVTAETNYSCLMLKTQRFSSLFRHYAKYHGLRKDDLEYYFVNPLENEDTPESVHLQRGDTIMVRKRRKPEPPESAADDSEFFQDMRELLEDTEHMDAIFLVQEDTDNITAKNPTIQNIESSTIKIDSPTIKIESSSSPSEKSPPVIEIRAHKCILTARAEYFKALFRKSSSFRESSSHTIRVEPCFSPTTIRRMLQFLYCNRISDLSHASTQDILDLLHLADKWLLRDLKRLCEYELIRTHMDVDNVAKMYCATEEYHAQRLSRACIDFIMENIREVTGNVAFQEEMKHYPHLCIPVLKAAADLIPEPVHKKQRVDGGGVGSQGNLGAVSQSGTGCGSSPVPDSDS